MQIKVLSSSSHGNCYLLQANEKEKLLLECGIPWKNILKGLDYNLEGIQGCLCSHVHKDHSKALQDVIKNGIDCYASKETFNSLEDNRVHYLKSESPVNIGNFSILPFESEHDCEGSLGFLIYHPYIGKILFLTDSYYCRFSFKSIDHVMIECNYSEDILPELPAYDARLLKSHMSLETCKRTLQALDLTGCKDITLIHISNRHGDKARFKREIEELTEIKTYIAEPGLIIEEE